MFDTAEFVADLRVALRETQPSLAVREVVERAISDPRGVERGLGAPLRADLAVLHAGIGYTDEHDIQLHTRRAPWYAAMLGETRSHYATAAQLLGI